MIYVKGTNPIDNDEVYYRRFFNSHCVSWTRTLEPTQAFFFNDIEIAQNLIIYLNSLNIGIINLEVIESI